MDDTWLLCVCVHEEAVLDADKWKMVMKHLTSHMVRKRKLVKMNNCSDEGEDQGHNKQKEVCVGVPVCQRQAASLTWRGR